jgi:SAM-dependent methyltransferase
VPSPSIRATRAPDRAVVPDFSCRTTCDPHVIHPDRAFVLTVESDPSTIYEVFAQSLWGSVRAGRMTQPDDQEERTRGYYDRFAATYEAHRAGRSRYHDLLDELEVELALPYVRGRDVLEVGCGTGLILSRLTEAARRAVGVDLSPGMLARARERGLDVVEGTATALPFPDASFDVVVSFKTLPHVPDLRRALQEMARVTRPSGTLVVELYNPRALRTWMKRLLPAARVADGTERDVFCRFDDRADLERSLPPGLRIERARGIRSLVPVALALELPVLGRLLHRAEHAVSDSWFAERYGGFVSYVIRRA